LGLDGWQLPGVGALWERSTQRREHLERDSGLGTAVDDALQLGVAGRRDRDDEQLDTALDGEAAQIADAAQHAHAVQRSPVRVPVVVDETHDVQLVPLVVQQLAWPLNQRIATNATELSVTAVVTLTRSRIPTWRQ